MDGKEKPLRHNGIGEAVATENHELGCPLILDHEQHQLNEIAVDKVYESFRGKCIFSLQYFLEIRAKVELKTRSERLMHRFFYPHTGK